MSEKRNVNIKEEMLNFRAMRGGEWRDLRVNMHNIKISALCVEVK